MNYNKILDISPVLLVILWIIAFALAVFYKDNSIILLEEVYFSGHGAAVVISMFFIAAIGTSFYDKKNNHFLRLEYSLEKLVSDYKITTDIQELKQIEKLILKLYPKENVKKRNICLDENNILQNLPDEECKEKERQQFIDSLSKKK